MHRPDLEIFASIEVFDCCDHNQMNQGEDRWIRYVRAYMSLAGSMPFFSLWREVRGRPQLSPNI